MAKSSWEVYDKCAYPINSDLLPNDIGSGRVQFDIGPFSYGVIYPSGGDKLDSAVVMGL